MAETKKFLDLTGLTRYDQNIKGHISTITGNLSNLETSSKSNLVSAINEANSVAKGATVALSSNSYSSLISAFSSLGKTAYKIGQTVYIVTVDVPDLWISGISDESSTYTYTTDSQVIADVEAGTFKVGHYTFSKLETKKVDLTDYVTTSTLNEIETSLETSLSEKATKVLNATEGNFASLNSNGNLVDSNKKPTDFSASDHIHGNIQNDGTLQTNDVSISSGDKLVITDSSDSNKVARAAISFDGSTATKALTQKGTFETFNNYSHPTTFSIEAAAVKVGRDTLGHVIISDALSKSDLGLSNVVNTGDSATPVAGGTTKFTTGGAYTELAKKADKDTDAVEGNLAAFDANGNPVDSGHSNSEYATVTALNTKADSSSVYQKNETYTRAEIDSLITTPSVGYITVEQYSDLPATGNTNTIYRVANWDGSSVVTSSYCEYAWNGSNYVLLAVKGVPGTPMRSLTTETATISPNVLNRWTTPVTQLTLTLSAAIPDYVSDYKLEFTVSGDNFELSLGGTSVRWAQEPTWIDGNTYQVTIINGLAVYAEWEAEVV